jgi:hypothetical protein
VTSSKFNGKVAEVFENDIGRVVKIEFWKSARVPGYPQGGGERFQGRGSCIRGPVLQ